MEAKKTFLILFFSSLFAASYIGNAQNSKIRVYFNHPVNTAKSSGTNAIYLSGTSADTIAAYINKAKYTVDVAQYDYTASSTSHIKLIATAINNARARGVVVRWIYNGSSPNSGLSLITWTTTVHKLASPVQSGYIMHNKFMVIDVNSTNTSDAYLWTGSFDWSDQQCSRDYNNMVVVQDKNVALTYYNEFNKMWGGTGASPVTANEKWGIAKTASTTTSFTVNGTAVQVYFSPKDSPESHLLNTINSANNELAFGIYTFTRNTVADAIKTKYTGGVAAFGIMDQFSKTYTPYTTLSAPMGTHLQVYTGTSIYHNKTMIVDYAHPASDPQVFTGSYNWTSAGANSNDESSVVIHDAVITNEYYQSLNKNFTDIGGSATVCRETSGINNYDYGKQEFAVYPNPFSDILNVQLKNAGEDINIRITDQLGKLVLEQKALNSNEMQLDLSGFSNGMYFISITSGQDSYFQKLVK